LNHLTTNKNNQRLPECANFFFLHRTNSIFLTQPLYALDLDQKLTSLYIVAASHGKKTRIDGLFSWFDGHRSNSQNNNYTAKKKKVCCCQIAMPDMGCWTVLLQPIQHKHFPPLANANHFNQPSLITTAPKVFTAPNLDFTEITLPLMMHKNFLPPPFKKKSVCCYHQRLN